MSIIVEDLWWTPGGLQLLPRPVPWCPKAYRLAAEKAVDNQGHYAPELAKVGVFERI